MLSVVFADGVFFAFFSPSKQVSAQDCEIKLPNLNGNGYGKVKKDLPVSCDGAVAITVKKKNKKIKTFHKHEDNGKRKGFGGQDFSDGSSFQYIRDKNFKLFGSLIDLEESTVTQFSVDALGNQVIKVTPSGDFPPEEDDEEVDGDRRYLEEISSRNLRGASTPTASRQLDDIGNTIIDVMVLWTKEAECAQSGITTGCFLNGAWVNNANTCKEQGETVDCDRTQATEDNMRSLIDLAIEETNTAYDESGVNAQLRLVHAQFFEYDEVLRTASQNPFREALYDTRASAVVGELRTTYGADIVSTIIGSDGSCGMTWRGPRIDLMFNIVRYSCATGYYTFGHEIGHNLGCNHDRGSIPAPAETPDIYCTDFSQYPYQYAWRDPEANFRTILAFACRADQCDNNTGGGCTRIQRFSNPTTLYQGKALGNAQNDNVRTMNENLATVAAYYPPVQPPTPNPTPNPTQPPTPVPTPNPTAAPTSFTPIDCESLSQSQCTNDTIYPLCKLINFGRGVKQCKYSGPAADGTNCNNFGTRNSCNNAGDGTVCTWGRRSKICYNL